MSRVFSSVLAGLVSAALVASTASPALAQGPAPQPQPQGQPQVIYVQQGPAPQVNYTYADVPALQARLLELRVARSQYSVGGPVAAIAVGAAVAAISGLVCMGFGLARSVSVDEYGPDGTDLRRGVRVSGALVGVGLGLTIFGSVRLSHQLRLRRQYDPEIYQIREQLRMMSVPRASLRVGPGGFGIDAQFAF